MTKMKPRIAVLLVAIAMGFGLGCASRVVTVGALDVAPRPPLPRQGGRLTLALAPGTPDAIGIQVRGFPRVEVRAFRTTLRRAFERAFAPSLASAGAPVSHAILQIEVTDISFVTEREARAWPSDGDRTFGAEIVLTHGTVAHPPKAKGHGLGLAIARSLARAHGGDITVAPRGDGQGTRATLILPVREDESDA